MVAIHGMVAVEWTLTDFVNLAGHNTMTHVLPLDVVLVAIDASIVCQPYFVRVRIGHQGMLVNVQVAVLYVHPGRTGIVRTFHSDAACVNPIDH